MELICKPFRFRPEDLKGAKPAKEVQALVAELAKGRVLVGHALDNDLAVLNLKRHPPADTRDTAKISRFNYRQKKVRAAVHLSSKSFDRTRRNHSHRRHCNFTT